MSFQSVFQHFEISLPCFSFCFSACGFLQVPNLIAAARLFLKVRAVAEKTCEGKRRGLPLHRRSWRILSSPLCNLVPLTNVDSFVSTTNEENLVAVETCQPHSTLADRVIVRCFVMWPPRSSNSATHPFSIPFCSSAPPQLWICSAITAMSIPHSTLRSKHGVSQYCPTNTSSARIHPHSPHWNST